MRGDENNFPRRFVEKLGDKLWYNIIYYIGTRLFSIYILQCISGNELNWIREYLGKRIYYNICIYHLRVVRVNPSAHRDLSGRPYTLYILFTLRQFIFY